MARDIGVGATVACVPTGPFDAASLPGFDTGSGPIQATPNKEPGRACGGPTGSMLMGSELAIKPDAAAGVGEART